MIGAEGKTNGAIRDRPRREQAMTDQGAHSPEPAWEFPATGELVVSDARRAELAPKLAALLADLRELEELDSPELEPAGPWNTDDDAGR
jgi:hypothetical protein